MLWAGGPAVTDIVSTRSGQHRKSAQHLSSESRADGPRKRAGAGGSCFPERAPWLFTPWLGTRPGHTDPGRSLPQRQPRSQAATPPPQFLQTQRPDPQSQPAPHHSLALDLGQTQQRKRCGPGLPLSGTVDAYTGGTYTTFGAGHTPKGKGT